MDTKDCNTDICKVSDIDKGQWQPVGSPTVSETQRPAEQDCKIGDWSRWSDCDKSCGTGGMLRERTVQIPPSQKGKECPPLQELVECNTQVCVVDCLVSDWSAWGECAADEKGDCQSEATRDILEEKQGTGNECPVLNKYQNCDLGASCSSWSDVPKMIMYVGILGLVGLGVYFFWHMHKNTAAPGGEKRGRGRTRGIDLQKTEPEFEVTPQNGKGPDLPPFVETKPPVEYEPLMAEPLVEGDFVQPPPPIQAPLYPLQSQPRGIYPNYPMQSPMSTGMSQPGPFRTIPMQGMGIGPSPFATRY